MPKLNIDFTDILAEDEATNNCEGLVLASPSQNCRLKCRCHVEITLKHPYDKKWSALHSTQQQKFYKNSWHNIKNTAGIPLETGYVFEFHKSGHVHLHGYIQYEFNKKFSPIGLIADLAKLYYLQLFKKYNYNENHMYDKYMRYCSPQITIQYINDDERPERLEEWKKYLLKENDEIKI